MYEKFGQFIDGKWQQSEKKETYEVINPATEEVLGHASKATPADVEKALKSAEKGLEVWKKTSLFRIVLNLPQKINVKSNNFRISPLLTIWKVPYKFSCIFLGNLSQ